MHVCAILWLACSTLHVLDAVTGMMVMAWVWRGLAKAPPDQLYHIIIGLYIGLFRPAWFYYSLCLFVRQFLGFFRVRIKFFRVRSRVRVI